MERPYFVIDAFAAEPFTGNPAAVLPDGAGLDDRQMARIAAEFNLSETTFILPPLSASQAMTAGQSGAPDAHVRIRWFTPGMEVRMCGHATVAGVHALLEAGRVAPPPDAASSRLVRIDTCSGTLTAHVELIPGGTGRMIWLDLMDPVLTPQTLDEAALATALALPPEAFERWLPTMRTQDDDVLVFVRDVRWLNEARPDFAGLGSLLDRSKLRGLSLATVNTLSPSISVQSRFFAPTAGVNEDPVTGSVHGPLAACLVKHGVVATQDGLSALVCVQGVPGGRTGVLHALVQAQADQRWAVRIGGRAVTTMRGVLYL